MELIKLHFDHTKPGMAEAFGLDEQDITYVKAALIFEIISTEILITDLFKTRDEAPSDLKTNTGVLERVLGHAKTLPQQMFMMYEFQIAHLSVGKQMQDIEEKENIDLSKIDKEDPSSIVEGLMGMLSQNLESFAFKKAKEQIIDSGHNFEKFYNESVKPGVEKKKKGGSIEDMLKKLFKGKGGKGGFEVRFGSTEDDD